jgi:hypothetical protein
VYDILQADLINNMHQLGIEQLADVRKREVRINNQVVELPK